MATPPPLTDNIQSYFMPKHFYGEGVTPWKLCEDMETSGVAHVDALRCDVIEYAFRVKGDNVKMIDDLEKAASCALRAVEVLKKRIATKNQPELFRPQLPECKTCPNQGPCPEVCDKLQRLNTDLESANEG